MSKSIAVKWTQPAVADLRDIVDYIAKDSPANARSVARRLRDRVARLASTPFSGRVIPELDYFGYTRYLELIETPWRIMYRVEKNTVFILAVLDARRNIEDIILGKLFLRRDME